MTIKQLTKKAGQASAQKRFKGKSKKEISAIMSAVRKGVAKHD